MSGLEGQGGIRTLDGIRLCRPSHSTTLPPGQAAEPISPLAGPLRGKTKPSVIVEDHGYETPCHIWQGAHNSRGYPLRGRYLLHRLVCEHHHGPIPAGGHAHHRCNVSSCVNPAHLEPVELHEHVAAHYPFSARAFVLCLLATHGPLPARWIRRIGADAFGFEPATVSQAIGRLGLEKDEDGCYVPPVIQIRGAA